jgi:hypothetical protein
MKLTGLIATSILVAALSACATEVPGLILGDPEDCTGVTVVVNFGLLSADRDTECVELENDSAIARDVLSVAGYEIEGTATYGDQVVCRVNDLPSESDPFVVEGEEPHSETCADMPPAFGYWALWVKPDPDAGWAYAEEGVGTLPVEPEQTLGLVFSTGGETPTPTDE